MTQAINKHPRPDTDLYEIADGPIREGDFAIATGLVDHPIFRGPSRLSQILVKRMTDGQMHWLDGLEASDTSTEGLLRVVPIIKPLKTPEEATVEDEDLDAVVRAVSETKTERLALLSDLGPYGTGQRADRSAVDIGQREYYATKHGEAEAFDLDEPAAVLFVAEE